MHQTFSSDLHDADAIDLNVVLDKGVTTTFHLNQPGTYNHFSFTIHCECTLTDKEKKHIAKNIFGHETAGPTLRDVLREMCSKVQDYLPLSEYSIYNSMGDLYIRKFAEDKLEGEKNADAWLVGSLVVTGIGAAFYGVSFLLSEDTTNV